MANRCTVCSHPKRLQIDREIVKGGVILKIARKYALNSNALYHHAENHLSRQLVEAYQKKNLAESLDLLAMIEDILVKAKAIFDRNFNAKKDIIALKALSEQRNTIDLLARIAAFLHESRALELQTNSDTYEERRRKEEVDVSRMIVGNLTNAEADMLARLLDKGHGRTHEVIIPDDKFVLEE